VIFEVVADALDRDWCTDFRDRREVAFRQQKLLIRATAIDLL
jgi:hypothetical protein